MEFHGLKTCIALVLALWVTAPGFIQWDEERTIPTSYVVTFSKLSIPSSLYYHIVVAKVAIGVHVIQNTETIILDRPSGTGKFTVTLNGTECPYTLVKNSPRLLVNMPSWNYVLQAGENYIVEIDFETESKNILVPSDDFINPITGKRADFAFGPVKVYEAFPCFQNCQHRASITLKVGKIPDRYRLLMSAGTASLTSNSQDL